MAPRGPTNAKEKIIDAASALFYEQGYQATTIDQVIERSGVSRPTVYSHFRTKEQLCVSYLQQRGRKDLNGLREALAKEPAPRRRFLAIMEFVGKTLLASDYRGCGYFNLVSEIPDPANPIVKEARRYVDGLRDLIREKVIELKCAEDRFKDWDVNRVSEVYYLIIGGAIMACQEYRESWPIDRANEEIARLLES